MNKPLFSSDFAVDPAYSAPRQSWIEKGNNALWLVGALWLECVIVWLFWYWGSFANLNFRDPDDAMRLVQVRDFLAGQSWFDVSQHRVNPPVGGPMHWSRLLDLPIAAIIVALRPLTGQTLAEIVACVTVPMMTLAVICFSMFGALKQFLGAHRSLLGVALLATSFPILTQLAPLRIDHHGWQIAMAVGVLGGILVRDPRLGGWIAGGAMAFWLHISGEGLPFAAITGAVLTLRYAARAEEWQRVIRYAGTLAGSSAVLLLLTHGWQASLIAHCDSMSPPYLAPLLLLFPAMLIGQRLAGDYTPFRRIAPVAAAGALAAALFITTSPQCLDGPFRTLDPLVYQYWYLGVLEGQPFWQQEPPVAAIVLVPSLVGIAGLVAASIVEKNGDDRLQWLSILGLALGSFVISALVLRAMSVAHLFALIGNGWIIARFYPRIAGLKHMAARVAGLVLLCVLTPAGLAIGASTAASTATGAPEDPAKKIACFDTAQIVGLTRMPATTLFAPVDLGPDILQRTRHNVIGTGHHRNVEGISKVIHAYISSPDEARKIVGSTQARYFLFCPALNETKRYTKVAPDGLAAQMNAGLTPGWLQRVHVPGVTVMQVYRIR